MATVSSFDVFDTVLTRRVGAPSAVIEVLARRLERQQGIPVTAGVFADARQRCERAFLDLTRRHATLLDVYLKVAAALNVDAALASEWAHAEEQLERELCVEVPGAAARVAEARSRSKKVVFVSDTPHTERFVHELLITNGIAEADDRVFTSSERGVSKAQGGLFRLVRREVGASHVYVHIGDNLRSDLGAARLEGWSGSLERRGTLSRYEELLERAAPETGGLTSWLAGASKLARCESAEESLDPAIAEVSAGVLGPLLVGYCLWVAGQAKRLGIQRLYFVSRDGHVMLKAAHHVIGAVAPEIELRYLFGSRQPWTLAASSLSELTLREWLQVSPSATPRTMLARVGLDFDEVHRLTGAHAASPERADMALADDERERLLELLLREPLRDLVQKAATDAARNTTSYLEQEGLTEAVPSALVDAGWSGRTAAAFDLLLARAGGPSVHHFFVGILGRAAPPPDSQGPKLAAWLFDERTQPQRLKGFPAPNTLIEMLCADTTGRTVGYSDSGKCVEPVFATPSSLPLIDWGVPQMQQVAIRVAQLMAPALERSSLHTDTSGSVWEVLRAFWTTPTAAEARVWGSFPFEEESNPPFVPVAERISTPAVVARLLKGERQIRWRRSWRAGSAMVSAQPWRAVLKFRTWHDMNRARLSRIPRRLALEATIHRARWFRT